MIPKKSLEKKLNVQIATSGKMDNAIQLWLNMYQNTPPWIGGEKDVKGLNLPAIIAEEMSRLVLTEFDIQLDGSPRAEYLLEQMGLFLRELNHTVEMWCALGGIVLKPYAAGADEAGNPDHIEIDVIQATRFYPTAFDSNKDVTGAVFIDTKRIGDYVYTRLEYHSLVGTHYTVTNKAFRSERIISVSNDDNLLSVDRPFSEEIPLEQVDDWKGIEPIVEMDGIEKPFFIYIKTPKGNNIDPHSSLGISVYARAKDLIEEADKQFSRTLWEYEAKEAVIEADETLFTTDKRGKPVLPAGKERLFRTYTVPGTGDGGGQPLLREYSPAIRDSAMFNGLDKLFRNIEFQCGLAYGTISDAAGASAAERTATEIKASKQRSYATVHALQTALDRGFDNLLYVMNAICDLYDLAPDGEVEKSITWGDGILEDTDVEYQRRWAMVLAGKLKLEKFYAWYFGCTEEQALEMIPQAQSLFPPNE